MNPKLREEPDRLPGFEMEERVRLEVLRLAEREERQTPVDHAAAERAVALAYHNSGFALPSEVRWLDSPFQLEPRGQRNIVLLRGCPDVTPERFRRRVASHVSKTFFRRSRPTPPLLGVVSTSILAAADAHLTGLRPGETPRGRAAFRSRSIQSDSAFVVGWVRSNLTHAVTLRLMAQMGEPLTTQEQVHLELWDSVWFCLPTTDVAYLSERPLEVRRDRDDRIHCENGPAIRFADGRGVAYWRDQIIPEPWVTGHPPSPVEAVMWENMDQRAAACEIVGWHNILRELRAREIDVDPDPMIGTLLEVTLPDTFQPSKFLRVLCGTGREFALPVPPETRTALHGQALLHDLPESIIRSIKKRT